MNAILLLILFILPFDTMGGQFRWASDNSKGFEKTSIFNNFEHLGLKGAYYAPFKY